MSARDRRELPGEVPGWEVDVGADCMTILHDGWAVCDIFATNTAPTWKASRPREEIPAFVLAALPACIADAVRRKATAG